VVRTVAFYGGRPRIGKTTAVANLATLFADAGIATGVIHVDDGWPMGEAFGCGGLTGEPVEVRPGLRLALCGGHEVERYRDQMPDSMVLLDVPAGKEVAHEMLPYADEVYLVAKESRIALSELAVDLQVITSVMSSGAENLAVRGLLVTESDRTLKAFERLLVLAERAFPVEVLPYCVPRVRAAGQPGQLVVEAVPGGRRARAYVEIAKEVLDNGR